MAAINSAESIMTQARLKQGSIIAILAVFLLGLSATAARAQATVDLDTEKRAEYQQFLVPLTTGSNPGQQGMLSDDNAWVNNTAMTLDRQGRVYVDDPVNHRIQRFDSKLKFLDVVFRYPDTHQLAPQGMAVSSDGTLFLALYDGQMSESPRTWRVKGKKVVSKDKVSGSVKVLADGKVWIERDSGLYISLDGGARFENPDPNSYVQWPLADGKQLEMRRRDLQSIEIKRGGERVAVVKGKKNVDSISFIQVEGVKLYFEVSYRDELLILGLDINAGRFDLHRVTPVGGWIFSSRGEIYGYRPTAFANDGTFNLVKMSP